MSLSSRAFSGIGHDLPDFPDDEFGGRGIGRQVGGDVAEFGAELQPARRPGLLEQRLALLGADRQGRAVIDAEPVAVARLAHRLDDLVVMRLHPGAEFGCERGVARRGRVVGGALEHGQLRGACGNHRHRLDAGRSGADLADPQPGEIHPLMRPFAGMQAAALEAVDARDGGHVGGREAAHGSDQEARGVPLTGFGLDPPQILRAVPARRRDPGAQADVAAEVEAVGHVVQVAHDLGLAGIALGPLPLPQQLGRKAVAV